MRKTKSILKISLLAAGSILFFSCSSTPIENQAEPDSYYDEGTEINVEEKTEKIETAEDKKKKEEDKKNHYVKDFFTFGNKNEIIPFDTASVLTPKVFGGLYQQAASILINLKYNTAGFGSKYQSVYYILQFDKESRNELINAVNMYFSDFERRALKRKDKKTLRAYGTTTAILQWGTLSSSTPNHGQAEIKLGYEFKDGHPYFVISIPAVKNDYYDVVGDATTKESMDLKYYFNKELAKDLTQKLSDENVAKYFHDAPHADIKSAVADEY